MNEKENKIRRLLGREYHLCTCYDEDLNLKYWVLHRRDYYNRFSTLET